MDLAIKMDVVQRGKGYCLENIYFYVNVKNVNKLKM